MAKFSAAWLVKKSACQLNYCWRNYAQKDHNKLIVDPNRAPNKNEIQGDNFARQCSISPYIEMTGTFTRGEHSILYSIDEIRDCSSIFLVEHKAVDREAEDWYFKSSLIQTAFYGSLIEAGLHFDKKVKLQTAAYVDKHLSRNLFEIDTSIQRESYLNFGNRYYKVEYDPVAVMKFFMTKARACLHYTKSRNFDKSFKHKEWDKYFINCVNPIAVPN